MKSEPMLGCSDIIESIIGKYKSFSAKTPMKEIGKTVLTIPVFTTDIYRLRVSSELCSPSRWLGNESEPAAPATFKTQMQPASGIIWREP